MSEHRIRSLVRGARRRQQPILAAVPVTRPAPVPDLTQPLTAVQEIETARLPRYVPQPEPVLPEPVLAEVPVTERAPIGEQLVAEMPDAYCALPCGYCGAKFGDAGAAFSSDETDPLGRLAEEAVAAGWRSDMNVTWSCPDCQQQPEWREREGAPVLGIPPRACESPADGWEVWVYHGELMGAVPVPRPRDLHPDVDHRGHQYAIHVDYEARVAASRTRMERRIQQSLSPELARTIALRARYADIDGLFDLAEERIHEAFARHRRPDADVPASSWVRRLERSIA